MAKKSAAKKSAAEEAATPSDPTVKNTAKKAAKKSAKKAAKKVATNTTSAKKSAKKASKKAAPTKKAAAKKTSAKKAATGTKSVKKTATKKSASKKAAAKKSAPKKATPRAAEALKRVQPPVAKESTAKSETVKPAGQIEPTVKRPAFLPATNGPALYRRQREVMPHAPEIVETREEEEFSPKLPESYGRTKISVLVRDQEWLFVYWEISDATIAEMGLPYARHDRYLVLRLQDVTKIEFDGTNSHSMMEIPVNDLTSSWYVHVPRPGRDYLVELGFFNNEGRFQCVTRSHAVSMPAAELSNNVDWNLREDDEEAHLQILQLSGGDSSSSHLSSADFLRGLQRRLLQEGGMFSGMFSGALFSNEFSSAVLAMRGEQKEQERKFWLVVDAEVIVYGATEPDAKVRFMGKDIRLNPDGTFGVRMALPDGKIEFPVEATSSDGEETLKVRPIVTRKTVEN